MDRVEDPDDRLGADAVSVPKGNTRMKPQILCDAGNPECPPEALGAIMVDDWMARIVKRPRPIKGLPDDVRSQLYRQQHQVEWCPQHKGRATRMLDKHPPICGDCRVTCELIDAWDERTGRPAWLRRLLKERIAR